MGTTDQPDANEKQCCRFRHRGNAAEEKPAYGFNAGDIEAIADNPLGNFFPTNRIPAGAISIFAGNYRLTKAAAVLLQESVGRFGDDSDAYPPRRKTRTDTKRIDASPSPRFDPPASQSHQVKASRQTRLPIHFRLSAR